MRAQLIPSPQRTCGAGGPTTRRPPGTSGGIDQADGRGDQGSADLPAGAVHVPDPALCSVESHLQPGPRESDMATTRKNARKSTKAAVLRAGVVAKKDARKAVKTVGKTAKKAGKAVKRAVKKVVKKVT